MCKLDWKVGGNDRGWRGDTLIPLSSLMYYPSHQWFFSIFCVYVFVCVARGFPFLSPITHTNTHTLVGSTRWDAMVVGIVVSCVCQSAMCRALRYSLFRASCSYLRTTIPPTTSPTPTLYFTHTELGVFMCVCVDKHMLVLSELYHRSLVV